MSKQTMAAALECLASVLPAGEAYRASGGNARLIDEAALELEHLWIIIALLRDGGGDICARLTAAIDAATRQRGAKL